MYTDRHQCTYEEHSSKFSSEWGKKWIITNWLRHQNKLNYLKAHQVTRFGCVVWLNGEAGCFHCVCIMNPNDGWVNVCQVLAVAVCSLIGMDVEFSICAEIWRFITYIYDVDMNTHCCLFWSSTSHQRFFGLFPLEICPRLWFHHRMFYWHILWSLGTGRARYLINTEGPA